ncbi:ATP-binding protein [bacterium]|nr:ATP-binding protein [bacterium]
MPAFRIAVASGKGGTGKTTIATSLVLLLAARGTETCYIDCDVEEPNGRIFLNPEIQEQVDVHETNPVIDTSLCTNCGRCSEVCRFNALAQLQDRVIVFPELCHACGACTLLCPEKAIHEEPRAIGVIETGTVAVPALEMQSAREGRTDGGGSLGFVEGRLSIGEARSTPIIRALKKALPKSGVAVLDAPPGASCPVVESVRDADLVVLVVEPTPFGLSDFKQALGVVHAVAGEAMVVVNKSGMTAEGDEAAERVCAEVGLEIVARLPEDRRVAEALARGESPVSSVTGYAESLGPVMDQVLDRMERARPENRTTARGGREAL